MRAGLASRVLANAVDGTVMLIALGATYLGVAAVIFLWSPRAFHFPEPSLALLFVFGYVFLTGYFTLAWWTTGRSYGDTVMGLRVVNRRGERMGLTMSFVRAACCMLVPIGLLWIVVSRENRSLQDLFLRTSVVYDWHMAPPPADSG
jgi:uncharacterized RDD family membrane protein YckC